MLIANKYLQIPIQNDNEFWNINRIKHIRQLALTGKPVKIFPEWDGSLRILDKIRFKIEKSGIVENPSASTLIKIAGIELSVPLYLGDMSYGALSGNPNIVIAKAADLTKTLAGIGEGGLHPEVGRCKRIFIQWASARFGIDIDVLMKGVGIVIKIGQGAKPGIGGHLPGNKVTEEISSTRRIPVGIDAISPAPHHDIYSIEDLGQRIEALKEATGKPVFVKVAATNYIPYIVSGIARMGADGVIIDGHGAGTGATPLIVRDNVGIPIELAVASADEILSQQGLRDNFTIIAGGRVADATDAAKLIALGADAVNIGTGALIAIGCIMCHKCHIGFCPATLTNKIDNNRVLDIDFGVKALVNFIKGFSLELANILQVLGLSNVNELKGRRDLLKGFGLSKETLRILKIESEEKLYNIAGSYENITTYFTAENKRNDYSLNPGELWTKRRETYLQELASKGNPVITSMGSNAPPDCERPVRILDWLRSDGAQVTRPSIDPYREDIDVSIYLNYGKVYLSFPILFDIVYADEEYKRAILWASFASSLAVFAENAEEPYAEITFSSDGRGIAKWSKNYESGSYILLPSSLNVIDKAIIMNGVPGFIIDEDLGDDDLEIVISEMDLRFKELGIRNRFDIIAKSSMLRDSADVFKMVALGADAVILSYKILERVIKKNKEDLKEKAFNLIAGFKREIALLAGAAGVYSLQSTLTGNRELLRAINLDSHVLNKIRVKVAGSL